MSRFKGLSAGSTRQERERRARAVLAGARAASGLAWASARGRGAPVTAPPPGAASASRTTRAAAAQTTDDRRPAHLIRTRKVEDRPAAPRPSGRTDQRAARPELGAKAPPSARLDQSMLLVSV